MENLTRRVLGLGATMAGVLIFGAGASLYELGSGFGGRTRGMPLQDLMMVVGLGLALGGVGWFLGLSGADDEASEEAPRKGPDQDGA